MELPITDEIISKIQELATGLHSIIGIKATNTPYLYNIDYIGITYWENYAPEFKYNTLFNVNLQSEIRDMKIKTIMSTKPRVNKDFDVETLIYTPAQLEILKKLRSNSIPSTYGWTALNKVKKEYSNNFEVGQRVFYRTQKGFITFKHEYKEGVSQRWSVRVGDDEFRRVYGHELLARKSEDLSHIEIDKELDKLPTVKLLKMYRRKMKLNRGVGDMNIKRILIDREHIQREDTNVIEVR